MSELQPFHLAIPVNNIEAGRKFYGGLFECKEVRSADTWVDYDFYGHQLVIHYDPGQSDRQEGRHSNPVDGDDVPVPHFGMVLTWEQWQSLAERLQAANIKFVIEPRIRFKGLVGEQATMFFLDPSGNALEFKAFRDMGQLFAK